MDRGTYVIEQTGVRYGAVSISNRHASFLLIILVIISYLFDPFLVVDADLPYRS